MAEASVWTVQRVLEWTAADFGKRGNPSARLDAELLLAKVLGCDRVRLYMDFDRPLDEDERARYRALVSARQAGTPVAYLLGEREFYGRPFQVDPRVLIPRPETELLVDWALELLAEDSGETVFDLCSGSGCVGVTLAAERPELQVIGVDLSADACAVAAANAATLGVEARYEQREGDLFAPLKGAAPVALITANPPYVAEGELPGLQPEVRDHEPHAALASGPEGLVHLQRLLEEAPAFLAPGGRLLLEHGETQSEALHALAEAQGWTELEQRRDLAGHPRLFGARRP